jgi:hypothetical protein
MSARCRRYPGRKTCGPGRRLTIRRGVLAAAVLLNVLVCVAAIPPAMADAWWLPSTHVDDDQPRGQRPSRIFAVGDSVMVGASSALRQALPGVEIDAAVGRQASTGIDILQTRTALGMTSDVVIFGLGTNGPLSRNQLDSAMATMAGVRRVVLVNNSVPRSWEAPNNALLADAVQRYSKAAVADWHAVTSAHPELLTADGIHLRPGGVDAYVALVAPYATAPFAE